MDAILPFMTSPGGTPGDGPPPGVADRAPPDDFQLPSRARLRAVLDGVEWMEPETRFEAFRRLAAAERHGPGAVSAAITEVVWHDDRDGTGRLQHVREFADRTRDRAWLRLLPATERRLRELYGIQEPQPDRAGEITRRAGAMARDIERGLSRGQPAPPRAAPARPEPREPRFAGSVPLPYVSVDVDPAGLAGAPFRVQKGVRPRVVECAACEYRKLETRVAGQALAADPRTLAPALRQHLGPGERDYALCQTCHDANGIVHPSFYERLAARVAREGPQRTLRGDPHFEEIAARVAAVEAWRRGLDHVDLAPHLSLSRTEAELRGASEMDGSFDGLESDRVARLSDFTGQRPVPGTRLGDPDPEFSAGASYNVARFRGDEIEAHVLNERWEAARTENFRVAWQRSALIEDPVLRQAAQERLVQRWDPRMSLVSGGPAGPRVERTSPFAEPRPSVRPYERSTQHSGVDEGFSAEPASTRQAAARHEEAVAQFLAEYRRKLKGQGIPEEKIAAMTSLPPLNPEREVGKFTAERPMHERIREGREHTPRLPSSAELDEAFQGSAAARQGQIGAAEVVWAEKRDRERPPLGLDVEGFVRLAGEVQQHRENRAQVREADEQRMHVRTWANALHRADTELRAATQGFAKEIRAAFENPQAFQAAFKALDEQGRRHALATLRERPGEFAREFGAACSLQGRRGPAGSTVSPVERAAVLASRAGEEYLDAAGRREVVRASAAKALGLPGDASLPTIRDACREQMRAAAERRGAAIAARDHLGRIPGRGEIEKAFARLDPRDQRLVRQQVPAIEKLVRRPGRELKRNGVSL